MIEDRRFMRGREELGRKERRVRASNCSSCNNI